MSDDDSRKNGKKTGYCSPPEHTRFKPGNPGRPKGSKNKLGEQFLQDIYEHWLVHGRDALERMCEHDPAAYVRLVASLVPRTCGLEPEGNKLDVFTDEELEILLDVLRDRTVARPDDEGGEQEAA